MKDGLLKQTIVTQHREIEVSSCSHEMQFLSRGQKVQDGLYRGVAFETVLARSLNPAR